MSSTAYVLEPGSGELYAFYVRALELDMDGWFVSLPPLAQLVHRTSSMVSSLLKALGIGSSVRYASRKDMETRPEVLLNVLATYAL